MKLFITDSAVLNTEFLKFMRAYETSGTTGFWVNGKREPMSGKWFTIDKNTEKFLFDGLTWANSSNTPVDKDCLQVAPSSGSHKFDGLECRSSKWVVCEISNASSAAIPVSSKKSTEFFFISIKIFVFQNHR
jgi:hypothetical protein